MQSGRYKTTHILNGVSAPLMISNVKLQDTVDGVDDLSIEDDCLVGVVSHAHLYQSLQDKVDQLHRLGIDIIVEMLYEDSHISDDIDGVDVVFLLSEVVLHEAVLPIAHQSKHLEGKLDVLGVLETQDISCLCIDASVGVILSGRKWVHLYYISNREANSFLSRTYLTAAMFTRTPPC